MWRNGVPNETTICCVLFQCVNGVKVMKIALEFCTYATVTGDSKYIASLLWNRWFVSSVHTMERIIGFDRHFNGIRQNVTFSSHTWLFDANHGVSLHARVVFAQNFSLFLSISSPLGKFNGVVEVRWANKIQCPMAHRHHCLININVRQEESIFKQQRPTHQIQIHCYETGDSSAAITLYQMKITTNNQSCVRWYVRWQPVWNEA